jgi:hypothetical protein
MNKSVIISFLATLVTLLSCDAFVPSSSFKVWTAASLKHSSLLAPKDGVSKSKLEMVSFSNPIRNLSSRIRRKTKFRHSGSQSVKNNSTWDKIRNKLSGVKNHKVMKLFLLPLFLTTAGISFAPLKAFAMAAAGGSKAPVAPMKREEIFASVSLFLVLFMGLSMLHAAEIAITTLYPWKVKEFAEEEEKLGNKKGVFKTLNADITRVLTTILVTSTASSIYGKLIVF